MRLISFDGIQFTGLESAYEMSAQAQVSEMRISGASGDYDLTGGEGLFGNQTYQADFLIVDGCDGDTGASLINKLRGAMQRRGVLLAEFEAGSRRRIDAKLMSVEIAPTFNDIRAGINRIKCKFRAPPFWYSDSLILIEPSSSLTMLAINEGNAVTRQIKFTLTPAANIGALGLACGDIVLDYDAPLLTSDTLVIDVAAGTVTKNGVNAYGNTSRPDTQMALFELAAGDNTIAASSAVTGRVEYRECWI